MVTIKSYTDISQSKKLAEILPLESADMSWVSNGLGKPFARTISIKGDPEELCACWSLAALLEQLPYEVVDDDGNSVYLQMNKEDDVYQLAYIDTYGFTENIYTDMHEHFVDACVEMILKLNELNLL